MRALRLKSPGDAPCWSTDRLLALNDAQYRGLGKSKLHVSPICLGTMQMGEGLSSKQSKQLISQAADEGINFLDTAEMYPVPQFESTQGASERIIGDYLRTTQREKWIISTKVAGPSGQMTYLRGGPQSLDRQNIAEAINGSLSRLQTDYIDLYLLHWPDRYVPMFGDAEYDPSQSYLSVPFEEQFQAVVDAREAGKILEFGVSNETPWGLMRFCETARQRSSKCGIAAVQNAYSLLCRNFDTGLAECCHQENISLMAYSPLAMGLLTGKYQDKSRLDPESRLVKYRGRYAEAESRYGPKPNVHAAVEAYVQLAQQAGLPPYEMALRFNLSRPLIASTVIGATSSSQLSQLTDAASNGSLPQDLLNAIDSVHQQYPNPTP